MFTEVRDVLNNYRDAVYEKDVEKFLSGYASDVHIFDCWQEWQFNGIEQWKNVVDEWFGGLVEEGVLLQAELYDESLKESEDLAHVHGSVSFTAFDKTGKELRKMKNRFTFVLEKTEGSWRITHEHSSLPIGMEDGKAIFD
ncbi:SgcJ/EcaC family oxidoreductase [uncultured Planococcus sp.]|uniref:YybH family protein n=1 Tax=uncultured Planococcus sp. TaxID=337815 RepID=UPI002601D385|nr:SgcJ/EcaC family oxidoreductase [uncultured Planococcus sp.]